MFCCIQYARQIKAGKELGNEATCTCFAQACPTMSCIPLVIVACNEMNWIMLADGCMHITGK